jgi:hypothetical protein
MVVLLHFWVVSTALSQWGEMALARAVAAADVVVFSELIGVDERRRHIEAIRETSPEKILVQMDEIDAGPVGGLDAMVSVGNGPGALVATIYGLLVEHGLPSRGWETLETTLLNDVGGPVQ